MLILSIKIDEIVRLIKEKKTIQHVQISIAEETALEIRDLVEALAASDIEFFGGVFPKIIHENKIYDEGIVVTFLENVVHTSMMRNIEHNNFEVPTINFLPNEHYSLITFVDGLTANISNYLSRLYENYGMQTNYFGGGAGSLTLEQKPCVFNNEGFFMDAAICCILKRKTSIGVKHGWNKLSGPYVVTKANKNIIQEINWENPFKLYQKIIEQDSKTSLNTENFFSIAKGYPFGMVKEGSESVIRDPLFANEKGELICVGEVEENTMVNIKKGDQQSLINAAEQATEEALTNSKELKETFIIDCISRVLFLEDDFQKEINIVCETIRKKYPKTPISGALTLGEISSFGNGYLEFYNKTIVIALME